MQVKINSLNEHIEKENLEEFTRKLYIRRQKDKKPKVKGDGVMGTKATKITQEDFATYARIQRSGIANTLDIKVISKISGLSEEKILHIQENYRNVSRRFKFIKD